MARFVRNTAILAKIEGTYGSDPTPSEAANAILVSNFSVTPINSQNVPRDLVRGYFGGSEHLVATKNVQISFDVEFQSSGSMTTPTIPAWGPLMRACGFSETGTASVRVEYNPISTAQESVYIYFFNDGTRHKVAGCRGNVSIDLTVGARPVFRFSFTGLYVDITAASASALTLTAWKTPLTVTDTNTNDLMLGDLTYTAATPAITGGTAYPSTGLTIDIGNAVNHVPLVGGETVDISQREVTGQVTLDVTAAQEVTFASAVIANTVTELGIQHGTTAGSKMLIYAPSVQMLNPRFADVSGRRLITYDLRLTPSSGNDEIKIVAA
jgi:hypothetical protein